MNYHGRLYMLKTVVINLLWPHQFSLINSTSTKSIFLEWEHNLDAIPNK